MLAHLVSAPNGRTLTQPAPCSARQVGGGMEAGVGPIGKAIYSALLAEMDQEDNDPTLHVDIYETVNADA